MPETVDALPPSLAEVADAARLREANINPETGLATDYLNLFNEIIMLLEMLPDFPDVLIDILDWTPSSYIDHFERSSFRDKELAILAYKASPFEIRCEIDALGDAINAILSSTIDALRLDLDAETTVALAQEAAARVKPMIAQGSGIINGTSRAVESDVSETVQAAQGAIDRLLERI